MNFMDSPVLPESLISRVRGRNPCLLPEFKGSMGREHHGKQHWQCSVGGNDLA